MYEYRAHVIGVYDGDTITVETDLGFNIKHTIKLRLNCIDTPEIRTICKEEKVLGNKVKQYVSDLILDKDITIRTEKTGKYGRYLADIYLDDGTYLNNHLIDIGYAKTYLGGHREPWFSAHKEK